MKIRKINEKNQNIILNIIAVIISILFLFPIYWIFISSFKIDGEIFAVPPTLFPETFTTKAYIEQISTISKPLLNSTIIAFSSMFLALILALPAGYGLAKYKMPCSKLLLLVFLVTQMLPASLVLTPLYLIFSKLNLLNTYLAPILATCTISVPFIILFLRPGFVTIPTELEDAAKIDGCNVFIAFIRIIIPVCKPSIITAACFGFVMSWNDLVYSMTFNSKEAMQPLTANIYQFMNQYGTQWNKIMAYGVILILPPCILFISMQKHIVSGLASGSVKG